MLFESQLKGLQYYISLGPFRYFLWYLILRRKLKKNTKTVPPSIFSDRNTKKKPSSKFISKQERIMFQLSMFLVV